MLRQQSHIFKRLNNLADIAITAVAFILAYQVRNNLATAAQWQHLGKLAYFEYYSAIFIISCILWPLLINFNGLYAFKGVRKFSAEVNIILKSSIEATVLIIAISYLFQLANISRLLIVGFALINFLFLIGKSGFIKLYYIFLRSRGKSLRHTILVGEKEQIAKILNLAEKKPELGMKIVRVINLNEISNLKQILHNTPADQVIFTVDRKSLPQVETAMFICEEEGLETWLATDFFELNLSRLEIEHLNGLPYLVFRTAPPLSWQLVIKYFLDFVFSAVFLIILLPLLIIVALAIKLGSRSQVFYIQERVGLRGKPFNLYKFRSMKEGDVTAVGKFIRKAGIDELPQLLNILKGEMSFVGPRPHVPSEVTLYAHGWQRRRLSMKPGITCYRQIANAEQMAFDDGMELDLKYIDNWSLGRDIVIVFKTIPLILSRFRNTKN